MEKKKVFAVDTNGQHGEPLAAGEASQNGGLDMAVLTVAPKKNQIP